MKLALTFPPPNNLLIHHPLLGLCYFVQGERRNVLRKADSGNEVNTLGVDITKGWTTFTPSGKEPMFYIFKLTTGSVQGKEVGVSGSDQGEAEKLLRAKLGLDAEATLEFVNSVADAATASFDELKGEKIDPNNPQGLDNNTSGEAVKSRNPQNPNLHVPANPAVEVPGGIQPAQAETDPSKPVIPLEGAPGDTMHPNG